MENYFYNEKLQGSEKLERTKLFIRFLKENHSFDYTLYAYNHNRPKQIKKFDDFLRVVRINNPYMSMFSMLYVAILLNLDANYFYDRNEEWYKYIRFFLMNLKK